MTNLLLTLDYELFNGLNGGTVRNCMIVPTQELCKVIDKYNFKATFFVDACFLLQLAKFSKDFPELLEDWNSITSQLKLLSNNGHNIELHLHPNWSNAVYKDGKWQSRIDDYKLSDMPKHLMSSLFTEGCSLLESIIGVRPKAFRAGAYCIQTIDNINDLLSRNNICIDSSVFRNRVSKTEKWEWYDYSKLPKEYSYYFDSDVCLKQENGQLLEVSIPSYRISIFRLLRYKLLASKIESKYIKPWGDGKTSIGGALLPRHKRFIYKIRRFCSPSYVPASIDGVNAFYLDYLFHKEIRSNGEYFMIMGHPKLFTPVSLSQLDSFLKKNASRYNNITISDFKC